MRLLNEEEASELRWPHLAPSREKRRRQFDAARHSFRCKVPEHAGQHFQFSSSIEIILRPWSQCALLIETHGIWESSENWNMYYNLCQRFGENREIGEARILLFPKGGKDDLTTFAHVSLGMGWDVLLLTDRDRSRVFVSHDEWACFSFKKQAGLAIARENCEQCRYEILQ